MGSNERTIPRIINRDATIEERLQAELIISNYMPLTHRVGIISNVTVTHKDGKLLSYQVHFTNPVLFTEIGVFDPLGKHVLHYKVSKTQSVDISNPL